MVKLDERWWARPQIWIEVFAILNIGFLTFDIFLAHSVNQFRNPAEYIPFFFSATASIVLLIALALRYRKPGVWNYLELAIGAIALLVGFTGLILHLESRFFYERTIRSLTYSAPFAAPLAYAGLGFLLIMNRLVDPASVEWAQWVLSFTMGGFVGNFIFSLADHAGNGFFNPFEWVPVIASAIAIGFLTIRFSGAFRGSTSTRAPQSWCWRQGWASGDSYSTQQAICVALRFTLSTTSSTEPRPWLRCCSRI